MRYPSSSLGLVVVLFKISSRWVMLRLPDIKDVTFGIKREGGQHHLKAPAAGAFGSPERLAFSNGGTSWHG
jgi:hypothetical protein